MKNQIEHSEKIARIAEANPDLYDTFIEETLIGLDEIKLGLGEEYLVSEDPNFEL